jgi:hypothetical protein
VLFPFKSKFINPTLYCDTRKATIPQANNGTSDYVLWLHILEDITAEAALIVSLTSKRGQPWSRRHCSSGNLFSLSTSSHVANNVLFKFRNLSFLKQLWGESIPGRLLDSHSLSVRPAGDVSASEELLFSKVHVHRLIKADISDQNYHKYKCCLYLSYTIKCQYWTLHSQSIDYEKHSFLHWNRQPNVLQEHNAYILRAKWQPKQKICISRQQAQLENIGLSSNYTVLQPTRSYSSKWKFYWTNWFKAPPKGISTMSWWWGLCDCVTQRAMQAVV